MRLHRFKYCAPEEQEEVLFELDQDGEKAALMAGGTDLVPLMKQRSLLPERLINIKRVPELAGIEMDGEIRIGAVTSIRDIQTSPILGRSYPILQQVASEIGYTQIRNIGTIGGNISNASPAADFAPALMILDGTVECASLGGTRSMPVKDFFLGPGQTVLQKNEMVTRFRIPCLEKPASFAFIKIPSRSSKGLAVSSVALMVRVGDGRVQEARIAAGAMGPTPIRCFRTEQMLVGEKITRDLVKNVSAAVLREMAPISDVRASKEYREHIFRVITGEALSEVFRENFS